MKLFFWIYVVVAAILLVVGFISTPIKDVSLMWKFVSLIVI